jgi:NAD-dependent deacetylase
MNRRHIVVISGAGLSAESGLRTFRDNGGLWENHRVEDVATPEAWELDRTLVLKFYNERRKALRDALPNPAHLEIASWERHSRVSVITQNVDDLHERAGSTSVLHLHGELTKARSTSDPDLVLPIDGWELREGDLCPLGSQLRPHIVWFGEDVPEFSRAAEIVSTADLLIVVGTSLQVYPAASLAWEAPENARRILVDPNPPDAPEFEIIASKASDGLKSLSSQFKYEASGR